ncbi:MAG: radical SAM protein [Lachnospiraceae bacterium]|nr:radical SAM protein [Lachnospiraceae bacterium]
MSEFALPRVTIPVILRCNLKCKYCINELQYFETKEDLTLEQFKKDLEMFFQIVDRVGKFELTGGEPFLRRDLEDFVRESVKYKDQFKWIRLDTNGTIPVRQELIDEIKKYGDLVEVFVSNYGEISRKAEENDRILTENNVNHQLRKYYGEDAYFGGWIDNGKVFDRKRSPEETEKVYHNCAVYKELGGCWLLLNGKLHLCARCLQGTQHGAIPSVKNVDYLDIHDPSLSIEEKREIIRNMLECKAITACAYCDGSLGTDDPNKRVTPAEQL